MVSGIAAYLTKQNWSCLSVALSSTLGLMVWLLVSRLAVCLQRVITNQVAQCMLTNMGTKSADCLTEPRSLNRKLPVGRDLLSAFHKTSLIWPRSLHAYMHATNHDPAMQTT